MFVDASALTAIAVGEADGEGLGARIDGSTQRITSPLAIWEAAVASGRILDIAAADAGCDLCAFLARNGFVSPPISEEIALSALDAFDRYGKGRHPAKLNLGDCFAYASARHYGVPLLYKGDDFALTDIERA